MQTHKTSDSNDCRMHVLNWILRFNQAYSECGPRTFDADGLFLEESFWRDMLSLTWLIQTFSGTEDILANLKKYVVKEKFCNLQIDEKASPPQWVNRAGVDSIEAVIEFETKDARCRGIIRLCPVIKKPEDKRKNHHWSAWTFFTAIDALKGCKEQLGLNQPTNQSYSRDFHGPNWLDRRVLAQQYDHHDPTVLVIGGGQAGLSVAARLNQLDVDTLIIDRNLRVGDNWRKRYHALTLHNQLHVNHLPYMPFPPTWPTYIPKDMLALWFETYVAAMELNFWSGCEVISAEYDEACQHWQVELLNSDSTKRTILPRHVIMATGVSGIPNWPDIETLSAFQGTVIHSSQYHDGGDWSGKRAIVVGCGNSGHDISQDLYSSGAKVTMIQRSPSLIVNIEPSAQFPYKLYDEGKSTDECDFITSSMPTPLVKEAHRQFTKAARENDRPLLDSLKKIGFKLDFGEEETGWQFKYLTRGGGYYFNVGCSDLLAEGKIDLVQYDQINKFIKNGMMLADGRHIDADIIVLATGYKPQEFLIKKIFGEDIAASIGPIWGFGDGQELRNMYCQTKQPGLWFIAGSFAQCRINSKYLALQIKALEERLIPPQEQLKL
ncbi:NAD(P)/FAD-dependent oxidoreductase [Candidatus Puniceispirillum sp.]|nr:NAD(P)/FAD-dependent oxidoreductase [Candidatus Puniceispirillum sp.]